MSWGADTKFTIEKRSGKDKEKGAGGELTESLEGSVANILSVAEDARQQIQRLEELTAQQEAMRERVRKDFGKRKVVFDVGGKRFATSVSTLTKFEHTYFYALISSNIEPDDDGCYFIDRNPKYFGVILDFLRTSEVNLEGYTDRELHDLQKEMDYYQIVLPEESIPDPGVGSLDFTISHSSTYPLPGCDNSMNVLFDNCSTTGLCLRSDCWLIADFGKKVRLSYIKVQGYHANSKAWAQSNGNGTLIYMLDNCNRWVRTTKVLTGLGNTTPTDIPLEVTTTRIKFVCSSYLGLSCLLFFGSPVK